MAKLPRYQPLGVRPAAPAQLDRADVRETARAVDAVTQSIDKMGDFIYRRQAAKAAERGKQAVEEQGARPILARIDEAGGPTTISEVAAYETANRIAAAEIQMEAEAETRRVLEEAERNMTPFSEVQSRLSDITDGFASALSTMDPEAAGLLRVRLQDHTGQANSRYASWYRNRQLAQARERAQNGLNASAETALEIAVSPDATIGQIRQHIAEAVETYSSMGIEADQLQEWESNVTRAALQEHRLYQFSNFSLSNQRAIAEELPSQPYEGLTYAETLQEHRGYRTQYGNRISSLRSERDAIISLMTQNELYLSEGGTVNPSDMTNIAETVSRLAPDLPELGQRYTQFQNNVMMSNSLAGLPVSELEVLLQDARQGIEGVGISGIDTEIELQRKQIIEGALRREREVIAERVRAAAPRASSVRDDLAGQFAALSIRGGQLNPEIIASIDSTLQEIGTLYPDLQNEYDRLRLEAGIITELEQKTPEQLEQMQQALLAQGLDTQEEATQMRYIAAQMNYLRADAQQARTDAAPRYEQFRQDVESTKRLLERSGELNPDEAERLAAEAEFLTDTHPEALFLYDSLTELSGTLAQFRDLSLPELEQTVQDIRQSGLPGEGAEGVFDTTVENFTLSVAELALQFAQNEQAFALAESQEAFDAIQGYAEVITTELDRGDSANIGRITTAVREIQNNVESIDQSLISEEGQAQIESILNLGQSFNDLKSALPSEIVSLLEQTAEPNDDSDLPLHLRFQNDQRYEGMLAGRLAAIQTSINEGDLLEYAVTNEIRRPTHPTGQSEPVGRPISFTGSFEDLAKSLQDREADVRFLTQRYSEGGSIPAQSLLRPVERETLATVLSEAAPGDQQVILGSMADALPVDTFIRLITDLDLSDAVTRRAVHLGVLMSEGSTQAATLLTRGAEAEKPSVLSPSATDRAFAAYVGNAFSGIQQTGQIIKETADTIYSGMALANPSLIDQFDVTAYQQAIDMASGSGQIVPINGSNVLLDRTANRIAVEQYFDNPFSLNEMLIDRSQTVDWSTIADGDWYPRALGRSENGTPTYEIVTKEGYIERPLVDAVTGNIVVVDLSRITIQSVQAAAQAGRRTPEPALEISGGL